MKSSELRACADTTNLEAMDEAHHYARAMQKLVHAKLAGTPRAKPILDFGAGRGIYAKALSKLLDAPVIGVEPNYTGPTGPLGGHEVEFVTSLAQIEAGSAQAAYCLNVLEHIPNASETLMLLTQKVQPGGRIFILVPAHQQLWTQMDDAVGHLRRYSDIELCAVAESAGLRVLEMGFFDRTGYFVTRLLQLFQWLRIRPRDWSGHVAGNDIRWFDVIFSLMEPLLDRIRWLPGKNVWVVAQRKQY